ncbi:hypothetical protein [Methanothermobacter thermautotrophicus]|jgi:hypothetical protein|uniref:Uncharacterized protein n=1 Tax=Methanothermobacter thermautotrophicus TaxID=145262 RepID=A0A7J4MXP6_METTF|nr:hypothetical protein [Methanothermobacter sp.]HIH65501.1 hypothetical protein [Methanothermobacter thermautotrophicus]
MTLNLFPIYREDLNNEILICPLKHPLINYEWDKISITLHDGKYTEIPTIGEISDKVASSSIIYLKDSPVGFKDQNNNAVTHVLLHESNINKEPYKSIKRCLTEEVEAGLEQFVNKLKDDDFSNNVLRYIFEKDKSKLKGTGFGTNIDELLNQLKKNRDKLGKEYPHLRFIINALNTD